MGSYENNNNNSNNNNQSHDDELPFLMARNENSLFTVVVSTLEVLRSHIFVFKYAFLSFIDGFLTMPLSQWRSEISENHSNWTFLARLRPLERCKRISLPTIWQIQPCAHSSPERGPCKIAARCASHNPKIFVRVHPTRLGEDNPKESLSTRNLSEFVHANLVDSAQRLASRSFFVDSCRSFVVVCHACPQWVATLVSLHPQRDCDTHRYSKS